MSKYTVKLASGNQIPLVGFSPLKVPKETAADTVYDAVRACYGLFNGSFDYQNEKKLEIASSEQLAKVL
jgi:D-xylose reductase